MKVVGLFNDRIKESKLCPLVARGHEPQECIAENCIFWKDGKCNPEVKKHDFEFK